MFIYKIDQKNFLNKYKARLVIRGDFQIKDFFKSIYFAILIIKSFCIIFVITAKFDLKVKQFDVLGVFLNINRDNQKPIYYELLNRFK